MEQTQTQRDINSIEMSEVTFQHGDLDKPILCKWTCIEIPGLQVRQNAIVHCINSRSILVLGGNSTAEQASSDGFTLDPLTMQVNKAGQADGEKFFCLANQSYVASDGSIYALVFLPGYKKKLIKISNEGAQV